jgi:arginyl-tRNA synthetase
MATNAAMVLAKDAKSKATICRTDRSQAADRRSIASVDVAGPGFINLTLKASVWSDALRTVLREGDRYGRSAIGAARRSMSNTSRPTRPGRCMSAIAAARYSACAGAACFSSRLLADPRILRQ